MTAITIGTIIIERLFGCQTLNCELIYPYSLIDNVSKYSQCNRYGSRGNFWIV